MQRPVLTYPNPLLKQVCDPPPAEVVDRIAADLIDTMRAHPGCVGLAAPQIGDPLRIAVVDVRQHRLTSSSSGLLIMVNPVISERSSRHLAREGCLSLPDVTADVERATRIVMRQDRGEPLWSEGFEARAIQHELDHLDGVLILDRIASVHALHQRRTYTSQ
jgi:peptide deformylase